MKREERYGLGLVEAVSLALVVALIGAVGYIVLLSDVAFKLSPQEVEPQPPIPAIPPYSTEQPLTEEERTKAIELAINDPEVKKWLGKGYEVHEVVPFPFDFEYEANPFCIVYILTKEQKLPWVLGITLEVVVDLVQEKVHSFGFQLKLASLTEEQKEEAIRIALADAEVLEMIGNREYRIEDVRVRYWTSYEVNRSFYAYPAVSIKIEEAWIPATVYVDLEREEVVKIDPFVMPPPTSPVDEYSTGILHYNLTIIDEKMKR
jgi:hypothetical protein